MPDIYISRQPLVNRQSKIIANRLTLHAGGASTRDAVKALEATLEYWPQGEKLVFINCVGTSCDATLVDWPAPANATLEVPATAFVADDSETLVAALKTTQQALCLGFDPQAAPTALTAGIPFRFIGFDAQRFTPAQLKILATKTQPFGIAVALNVRDNDTFQGCLDAGVNAAASWFFLNPGKAPAKALNAGQAQIIRVLNLVRKNAEIKEIEAALKQDVALSYKLLRYINSAGFGLSCEVQSFRHAVTILGYEKLNKWLSLLLATASKDPMAPALMHTALTRARLMEILAHGLVDRSEYDNLFIAGAFSLLDALLGVTMDKVLESMSLPEPICDALLGHGGVYGPFLDLAKASEGLDGEALASQAQMLGLSAEQFNNAQMQALAFADTMEL